MSGRDITPNMWKESKKDPILHRILVCPYHVEEATTLMIVSSPTSTTSFHA